MYEVESMTVDSFFTLSNGGKRKIKLKFKGKLSKGVAVCMFWNQCNLVSRANPSGSILVCVKCVILENYFLIFGSSLSVMIFGWNMMYIYI